jgi:hypothetical protein
MKKKNPESKFLSKTVMITELEAEALSLIAEKTQTSFSEQVRNAIDEYVRKQLKKQVKKKPKV